MVRVCMVEDDPDMVWVVRTYLTRQGHTVDAAHSVRTGYRMIQETRPEVILLDILLSDGDGFELCRKLKADETLSAVPVLFLTVSRGIQHKVRAFDAGADDYLPKPVELKELELRIRALASRATAPRYRPDPLVAGDLQVDPLARTAQVEHRRVSLTQVESELLCFLARNQGRLVSSQELLQKVWGYPPRTGNRSLVRGYIRRLRRKIEPQPDRPVYLKTRGRQGYVLEGRAS